MKDYSFIIQLTAFNWIRAYFSKKNIYTKNDFKLKVIQSLLFARDKPVLNKAGYSLPLELFW